MDSVMIFQFLREDILEAPVRAREKSRIGLQAAHGNPLTLMAAYTALEDEERRETGRDFQVIHPRAPHVPTVYPLPGPRSAGVALLQE
jgi:hypothetical protein